MFEGTPPVYFQIICTTVVVLFTLLWLSLPFSALVMFVKRLFKTP